MMNRTDITSVARSAAGLTYHGLLAAAFAANLAKELKDPLIQYFAILILFAVLLLLSRLFMLLIASI
jgi:hypothetical protein